MKTHILTFAVEDYFHVAALRGAVLRKHWERLEPRLESNLLYTLDLLDRHQARATFFVFGRIAERQPQLVRHIAERGHEVASRGYWPRSAGAMSPAEFLEDVRRAKEALEAAGSNPIIGYRAPSWMRPADLWMLDVLAEEGYHYDASINPLFLKHSDNEVKHFIHKQVHGERILWEFPVTTVGGRFGVHLPISGGNYIRQIPHSVMKRFVEYRSKKYDEPMIFYFMPWELDSEQPVIQGISRLQSIRHYRNLGKARWVLEDYFRHYRFVGIADYLELSHSQIPETPERPHAVQPDLPVAPGTGMPITLVVPIFNEEKNVTYLRRTLLDFRVRLSGKYRAHFVLVDDCSTDHTERMLKEAFAGVADCQIVRHEVNQGVAAGILTGIRAAPTEVVCSIDCDCSYDPQDLEKMLPLLEHADMVTASPYHPAGKVFNVPDWRLFLSKSLSRMYSQILHERIFTFTSCCRVYRRKAMTALDLKHGGFLGMAEMLIELKLAGGRIVEYPATLEARLLGESKMKIVRTIRGHLGLLRELAFGGHTPQSVPGLGQDDAPPAETILVEPVTTTAQRGTR